MKSDIRYRYIILFIFLLNKLLLANCDEIKIDVPKCCEQGLAFNGHCEPSNNSLVNPFIPSNGQKSILHTLICDEEGSFYLDPDNNPNDKYVLLPNSNLQLEKPFRLVKPDRYCMELIVELGEIRPMVCLSDEVEKEEEQAMNVYSVGMLLSLPFLFVTFFIYILIRELRTLHGLCLSSHIFALFMGYLLLGTLQQFTTSFSDGWCTALGFSVQYFFLATFFWLNVMCLDIYWAFSSVRSRGRPGGGDRRKLLLYSLYAWGMPLIILGITIVIDVTDLVPSTSPFKPKVGVNKCFFDDRESSYTYFYGPMALILCVNMVLFGITAYRIWRTSKETASLNRGDSRRHSDKQENERFKLYLKLFLVMGINWVAELVSFIFGEKVPHYLWYVSDITNTLQGVFIFIIFVWKRRVRRLVWDRVCMLTGHKRISRSRGGTSSDATTTTTTSINNTAVSQLRLNSVSLVK